MSRVRLALFQPVPWLASLVCSPVNMEAVIITCAILGVPHYDYSMMGTKTLLNTTRAPILKGLGFSGLRVCRASPLGAILRV